MRALLILAVAVTATACDARVVPAPSSPAPSPALTSSPLPPSPTESALHTDPPRPEARTAVPGGPDEALMAALLRFARAPGPSTFAAIPFADTVSLGLGERLIVTRTRAELARPDSWKLQVDHFRAYVGPFTALAYLERTAPTRVLVGPHSHCASTPVPAPAAVASLRRVSVEPHPVELDTCLKWWTVDVFLNADGRIVALTLDMWEP